MDGHLNGTNQSGSTGYLATCANNFFWKSELESILSSRYSGKEDWPKQTIQPPLHFNPTSQLVLHPVDPMSLGTTSPFSQPLWASAPPRPSPNLWRNPLCPTLIVHHITSVQQDYAPQDSKLTSVFKCQLLFEHWTLTIIINYYFLTIKFGIPLMPNSESINFFVSNNRVPRP